MDLTTAAIIVAGVAGGLLLLAGFLTLRHRGEATHIGFGPEDERAATKEHRGLSAFLLILGLFFLVLSVFTLLE